MTTVSGTSSITSTASSTTQASDKKSNDELDQADFLRLLTTQLQNQDPTNPIDGQEFMAQMAQFSTLNAIIEMKTSLDSLISTLESGTSTTTNSTAVTAANNSTATTTT